MAGQWPAPVSMVGHMMLETRRKQELKAHKHHEKLFSDVLMSMLANRGHLGIISVSS